MFDRDSSSVERSLIGLVTFRSNPVSKVYLHSSCNGGIILEVACSTGSLRKNSKRHRTEELTHNPFRNLLI